MDTGKDKSITQEVFGEGVGNGERELCLQGMLSQTRNQYLPSRTGWLVLVGEEINQEVEANNNSNNNTDNRQHLENACYVPGTEVSIL